MLADAPSPDVMPDAERTRSTSWATGLFWILAAVPVVVTLLVPSMVLQDGGQHLTSSVALNGLVGQWWPDLLQWRAAVTPNLTVELSLLGLLQLAGPDTALRLVTMLGMLGYAVAVALLMRALRQPLYVGISLLPFEMHFLVMTGYLAFVWAVPLALAAIAQALRRPVKPAVLPLTVLLTATWLTHLVAALVATLVVMAIVLCAHLGERERVGRSLLAMVRYACWPAAPVLLLSGQWWLAVQRTASDGVAEMASVVNGATGSSGPVVSYVHIEYLMARAVAAACVVATVCVLVYRLRRGRRCLLPHDGILAAGVLLTGSAIVLPQDIAGAAGFVTTRLFLFAAIVLMLWVITQWPDPPAVASYLGRDLSRRRDRRPGPGPMPARVRRGPGAHVIGWWLALLVTTAAATALPVVRVQVLRPLSDRVEQIRSLGPCLPLRSTFVHLDLDPSTGRSVGGGYLAAEQTARLAVDRQALDMGNGSAGGPFSLWRYQDHVHVDGEPAPGGSLDAVTRNVHRIGIQMRRPYLEAVVVSGRATADAAALGRPATQRLLGELDALYRVVDVSEDGNAELWLRRGVPVMC